MIFFDCLTVFFPNCFWYKLSLDEIRFPQSASAKSHPDRVFYLPVSSTTRKDHMYAYGTKIARKKFKPSVNDILCSAQVLKCTQNSTKTLQLLHGIVGQFVKNLLEFKVLVSST
uniref:Uncharacterized protein n=1 Tax=Schizaphis graminum TaxID=13262 RepID=A0A2S2NP03_SCHGA